jgi:hypothetical protein
VWWCFRMSAADADGDAADAAAVITGMLRSTCSASSTRAV